MTCKSRSSNSRRCSFTLGFITILGLALVAVPTHGQTAPLSGAALQIASTSQATSDFTPQPAFEVSSIRMADSSPHSLDDLQKGIGLTSPIKFPTNPFYAHYAPLKFLISLAYGVEDWEHIQGGPSWLGSQNYDIEAKVDGDRALTLEQMRPLLQNLLEQRFHLTVHREQKEVTGYALVVAKGGPKLQPSKEGERPFGYILPNGIQDQNASIQSLASMLTIPAGGTVTDKTGIVGSYDFKLKYATASHPDSNLPDLFTAVEEQLGLKLEPQRAPVDFLVIDHVDKIPTEN
jgi:uncharacterized protein (TIGR03435 family)